MTNGRMPEPMTGADSSDFVVGLSVHFVISPCTHLIIMFCFYSACRDAPMASDTKLKKQLLAPPMISTTQMGHAPSSSKKRESDTTDIQVVEKKLKTESVLIGEFIIQAKFVQETGPAGAPLDELGLVRSATTGPLWDVVDMICADHKSGNRFTTVVGVRIQRNHMRELSEALLPFMLVSDLIRIVSRYLESDEPLLAFEFDTGNPSVTWYRCGLSATTKRRHCTETHLVPPELSRYVKPSDLRVLNELVRAFIHSSRKMDHEMRSALASLPLPSDVERLRKPEKDAEDWLGLSSDYTRRLYQTNGDVNDLHRMSLDMIFINGHSATLGSYDDAQKTVSEKRNEFYNRHEPTDSTAN
jgi:hypothetical protein